MSQEHFRGAFPLHQQHVQYEILAIILSTCRYFYKYNNIKLILLIFIMPTNITIKTRYKQARNMLLKLRFVTNNIINISVSSLSIFAEIRFKYYISSNIKKFI